MILDILFMSTGFEVYVALGGNIFEDFRFCCPIFRLETGSNSQLMLQSLEIDLVGLGDVPEYHPRIS